MDHTNSFQNFLVVKIDKTIFAPVQFIILLKFYKVKIFMLLTS